MELILKSRTRRVKRPVEQDHYWYDHVTKRMFHGIGGKMEFVYDPKQKRSLPKVVDHEEWIQGNDYSDIKEWLSKNKGMFGMSISYEDGRNINTNIPVTSLSDVLGVLYRAGIMSDYDEIEVKKELKELERR